MESDNIIISLDSERLGYGNVVLANPHKVKIRKGITVVYGKNGSGKTTLGTIMEKGRHAYGNRITFRPEIRSVKMLSFTDIHSLSGMEVQYHAQRMEATMNDMVPEVAEILGCKIGNPLWQDFCRLFNLNDVEGKKINFLSSGELRKLLTINALLDNPDVLILDNPYIGLDASSRLEFDNTVRRLPDRGVSVIMLLCDPGDIPEYASALITMESLTISKPLIDHKKILGFSHSQTIVSKPITLPLPLDGSRSLCHEIAFSIHNGHIRYGSREILKDIDWTIRKGGRWVLTGANGCGKSLLLSLICADNPQAYANDITLFDRKRGSGESIWEIKNRIGYVSPEMQLFFKSNSSVREIVMQGLRNPLNRYKLPTEEEISTSEAWMELLDLSHLAEKKFSELSNGEQRLVLVARAMIRQPELLVLDEPLHGLDADKKNNVKTIIDTMTAQTGCSLIFVTHYTSEIPSCITHTKNLTKL